MERVRRSNWFGIWVWRRFRYDRGVEALQSAVIPAERRLPVLERPIVHFDGGRQAEPLSVRAALAGKRIMLIGVTGFIGKVWLVNLLMDLPEIGRIYLLIRRQKSNPAQGRFEKLVEESPVFDPLYKRYGAGLARFLRERVEVVEGDVSRRILVLRRMCRKSCARIWISSSTVRG